MKAKKHFLPIKQTLFKKFSKYFLVLVFSENIFNFVTQKFAKNSKMLFSKVQNIHFWPQDSFKTIFWNVSCHQLLIVNDIEGFAWLSRKTILTSSLKNLQKIEKSYFPRFITFAFELKVDSKPISKTILMIIFWLKWSWRLYLALKENSFNTALPCFPRKQF